MNVKLHRAQRIALLLPCLALAAAPVHGATITVTTTVDNTSIDLGVSLREALFSLNAGADLNSDVTAHRAGTYGSSDQISFAIGTGAKTIAPTSPLPPIRQPMIIDGSTQPGFAGSPLITLLGTNAGTGTDGLVVVAASGATVSQLVVQHFNGRGVVVLGYFVYANGFELDNTGPPASADATDIAVTFDHVVARDNSHGGFAVYGTLSAKQIEGAANGADGMLVDSAQPIDVVESNFHNNAQAGVRLLRTSDKSLNWPASGYPSAGFDLHVAGQNPSMVMDNVGDGILIGDTSAQTGLVQAAVTDTTVSGNGTGIWIREKDRVHVRTYAAVSYNNIYANRSVGLHVQQSYFLRPSATSVRAFVGNLIHNNARSLSDDCSGTQTAPQVWFEDEPPYPCFDDTCTYPVNSIGIPTDPVCAAVVPSPTAEVECDNQASPLTSADGIEHSCAWNQASGECQYAYPFIATCGVNSNLLWGYEGSAQNLPNTVGMFVSNHAAVRADGNSWQFGGENVQDWFVSGGADTVIRAATVCATAPTTCP